MMHQHMKYDASTHIDFHANNLKLLIKKDEKDSVWKLSLPLIITFWFPFMISFSSFGPNHGNEGNVGAFNKNITDMSSYPYLEDQGRNHTDKVLSEFNISNNHKDITSFKPEEIEGNPLQETTSEDEVFWNLDYPSLLCERKIQDMYLEDKQEDIKTDRTHLTYLNGAPNGLVNITHRLEPDGTEYNYASALKGAKVVAYDKEAKGASNILSEDHDMYLRNPCSVPEKYVVIELAEETLVDAIKIANFEHHSSNFKQFELLGSLVFPTETWYELGTFVAENVKHKQYFTVPQPKWVRYIMLRLLTHYGSEFYCTLSVFEAYGVDAVEKMLEDFITAPVLWDTDDGRKDSILMTKVPETVTKGNGRVHGDAVLKILMQKIRSLDDNLMLLEDFINETDKIQGNVLPHLDNEIVKYSGIVEETRLEINDLWRWKESMEKEITDLESWKVSVSSLLESIVKENAMLRQDIEKIASDEESLNKAEHALLSASLSFSIIFAFKILSHWFSNSSPDFPQQKAHKPYQGWKKWKLLVFTSVIMIVVILTYC